MLNDLRMSAFYIESKKICKLCTPLSPQVLNMRSRLWREFYAVFITLKAGYYSSKAYFLCFSISLSNPFLPRPVCFGPRIAIRVPRSSEARVSGIKVTRVRSLMNFVMVTPCVALLPINHPPFLRRRINCLPVIAGKSASTIMWLRGQELAEDVSVQRFSRQAA